MMTQDELGTCREACREAIFMKILLVASNHSGGTGGGGEGGRWDPLEGARVHNTHTWAQLTTAALCQWESDWYMTSMAIYMPSTY